jgi:hypothetical protein
VKKKMKFLYAGSLVVSLLWLPAAQAQESPYRKILQEVGSGDLYKDADVAVVFDSTRVQVENTGLSHVTSHQLLKVLTWSGARRLTALRFDYDPASNIFEPRLVAVHRANGTLETVPVEQALDHPQPQSMIYWGARMKVLELPRLYPGDAVEMETYKKGFQIAYLDDPVGGGEDEKYIPPMRGHFYDVVTFQGGDPIREKVYTMYISKNLPAQFSVYNGEVFSSVTFEDTLLVYRFWKKNVPVYAHEPRQPDATDFVPKVVLATVKDWQEKSRWFFQVNDPVFAADDNVRATAREIARGLKSDDEKIAAVLHWTAQNIRYSGISMGKGEGYTLHPGIMTLHDRAGVCKDIAGMSITLLRALGYTVYPAMTMAGARVERIPADQFNHCVVAVKREDGSYTMIDPTWAPYGMDIWSPAEGEQNYVIGSPEGEDLTATRSFTAEENRTNIRLQGSLNADGDLEGVITIDGTSYGDTRIRRGIAYTPAQNHQKMYADWVAFIAPNAEVVSAVCTGLGDLSRPARVEIRFRAPGYALKVNENLIYSPAAAKFAQASPRTFDFVYEMKAKERQNPMLLWNPRLVTILETVTLPRGYVLKDQHKTADVKGEFASATIEVKQQRDQLQSKLTYLITQRTLQKEYYPEVKGSYDAVKDFARESWLIKKGS